ncbi:hypothetical protein WAI453_000108 [Rhynchosporium graminicola]
MTSPSALRRRKQASESSQSSEVNPRRCSYRIRRAGRVHYGASVDFSLTAAWCVGPAREGEILGGGFLGGFLGLRSEYAWTFI